MELDNVTFLIMWFMIMFITLASGILFIMYRVGCFKCDTKVGMAEVAESIHKFVKNGKDSQNNGTTPPNNNTNNPADHHARGRRGSKVNPASSIELESHPMSSVPKILHHPQQQQQQQQLERGHIEPFRGGSGGFGPHKMCSVCGDPLEPEDQQPGEGSHPACRDMDASFF